MTDKRSFVRAMFARIAPGYDLANRLMTFGLDQKWRRQTAHLAVEGIPGTPRVLDLATGTGDLAFALADASPGSAVVGLDLTFEMLRVAHAKAGRALQGQTVYFVNGDTLDLPFPDASFAAITSGFMLRNLTDLERGFREMVRVTRPGGRIAALEITRPTLPVWRELYASYFYYITPLLGGAVTGDFAAYRYLPNSLTNFYSAPDLAALMRRAGVRDVGYQLLNLGTVAIHYGSK